MFAVVIELELDPPKNSVGDDVVYGMHDARQEETFL